MSDLVITRSTKADIERAIEDHESNGWKVISEIVEERHAPKRFSAAENKRFKFEENDDFTKYKVKLRRHISPKRGKMMKELNVLQQDVISLFRKLLDSEEKTVKELERMEIEVERSVSSREEMKVENEMLRRKLKDQLDKEKSFQEDIVRLTRELNQISKPEVQKTRYRKEMSKARKKVKQEGYPAYMVVGKRKMLIDNFATPEEARAAEEKAKAVL